MCNEFYLPDKSFHSLVSSATDSLVDPVKYENVEDAKDERDILREGELVRGIASTSVVDKRLGTLCCVLLKVEFTSIKGSECALWWVKLLDSLTECVNDMVQDTVSPA